MKSFIKYIIVLLAITFGQMFLFDTVFTRVYKNGVARDKIGWLKSYDQKDTLDYALLGSSRCIHHINPDIIENRSGFKGLNLGYASSGPVEIKMMIKEIVKKTPVKTIFVQVDFTYNQDKPDKLARIAWLPYLSEDHIYDELKGHGLEYGLLKYLPFYKYQINDPQIGFRNVVFMALGKKGDFIEKKGYVAINGAYNSNFKEEREVRDSVNTVFNEIINLCNDSKVKLVFFTSPIYNSTYDFTVLNRYLPDYHDFSNSISEIELYKDRTHLNREGSEIFTEIFNETFFGSEEQREKNKIFVLNTL